MAIECIGFKAVNDKNRSTLVGIAHLLLTKPGLEIYGCTLHMKDGRRWVNLPFKEYVDGDGKTKYVPVNRFRDSKLGYAFCEKAKIAIDEWCRCNAQEKTD